MSAALHLAEQLISHASVTPADAGCQEVVRRRLDLMGFVCETMHFGPPGAQVTNLWAKRQATGTSANSGNSKTLVFAGHTDVVPTGPLDQWDSAPFVPTHRDGKLYGRGASDMKSSIAAFVVATEEFFAELPHAPLSVALLLTSDEEGPALDGTVKVCAELVRRGERIDYCVVGEPTSVQRTGDMIKNGRRGSLSGKLQVQGVQGHVAYPHLARNAVHLLAGALAELAATQWDNGTDAFPPTTWQVSNLHAGTGVGNVVPGTATLDFNFRFCTASTPQSLQQRVLSILQKHAVPHNIQWTLGAEPFITPRGALVEAVQRAILQETGIATELSTTGGTSDARFIARICPEVVELGPPNASIHQINEHIVRDEVEVLKNIYRRVLENVAAGVRQ